MPKRKGTPYRETKEEFYQGGIYRTSHRQFARLSRGSRTDSSRKKPRTETNAHGLSDEKCRALFSNRSIKDPSLTRLHATSSTKPTPKTTRASGGKKTFAAKTNQDATQSLEVGEGKYLFLVHGTMSPAGSGRYDYLSEIYMHGANSLLPSTGRAKEILPIPMTPGTWNVADMGNNNVLQEQSDWGGKRLCLYHEAFPAKVVSRTKVAFRVVRTTLHFVENVGSLVLLPFDGFESSEESQDYQGTLAAAVLDRSRRHPGWTKSPAVCLPSVQVGCFQGCGGVAIAVHIRAAEPSACYMKLTSYNETNQLVAAELVFHSTCTTSRKSEDSSLHGLPLTIRNVKQHARGAQTGVCIKPAVSNLVTQQKAERRQLDVLARPKPLLMSNHQNGTPTALRLKRSRSIDNTTEPTQHPKPVHDVRFSCSLSSFQSAVQYTHDNKGSIRCFKEPTENDETGEKQDASENSQECLNPKIKSSIWDDEDLCADDLFMDSTQVQDSNASPHAETNFALQSAKSDIEAKYLRDSDALHSVEQPSPSDRVRANLFPSLPGASEVDKEAVGEDRPDFFHDAYFGLQDPHDTVPITDFKDEDLILHAREDQNDSEFHDVIYGKAKSTSVFEWVVGFILLIAFFGGAYYARPLLYALATCNSGDEVDFNSMILAGEGFAEFVYKP